MISPATFSFLTELAENNHKTWFEANKHRYLAAREEAIALLDQICQALQKVEALPPQNLKKQVFRIYRDVRFAKDKAPYKTNIGLYVQRKAHLNACDWYIHLEPGKCFLGGGLYEVQPEQLSLVRQDIDYQPSLWREILAEPQLQASFGTLQGEQLKTNPKGYDKEHPAIDLLRYKQYLLTKAISEEEVCSPDFVAHVVKNYQIALPLFQRIDQALSF
jgi:uncharacterized protein (TIGR02453 family)